MTTTTTLHAAAHPRITLATALAAGVDASALTGATALLTAPSRYHVALLTADGSCLTPASPADPAGLAPVDLAHVYEARVFTPTVELRWLGEAGGPGRAVVLTEDPSLLPHDFPETDGLALDAVDTLDAHHLLWGEATTSQDDDGWTTLSSARVGTLTVPVPVRAGARARVGSRQYVAVEPHHGNAHVAEERLTHLEPYDPSTPQEGDNAS
ncbi:type III-D CRISPR-associated protein Csx19 [Streptomyces sp. 4N509B]|uniref:type III-D CRISPR-associated protein Csx19 n=1 Tax=Streptomyces sp. 4N509B TaxID=3457413 RepID=UPI003FD0C8F6